MISFIGAYDNFGEIPIAVAKCRYVYKQAIVLMRHCVNIEI